MEQASEPDPVQQELDEIDRAWLRRRGQVAPLAFGIIGMALSPFLLGLVLGPMAMRAGVDRWRSGLRKPVVAIGVASGFTAVVLSVVAALLWGSVLATVLLGRDAMREAERWRGKTVDRVELPIAVSEPGNASIWLRPDEGEPRLILVAADNGQEPSRNAILAIAASPLATMRVVLIDRGSGAETLAEWTRSQGLGFEVVPRDAVLPAPLDAIAALPMTISIDSKGRIEGALIGVRPAKELETLLAGKMAVQDPDAP